MLIFHNSSLNIGRSGPGHSSITYLLLSGSHLKGSWGYARGYTNQPLHHHSHFNTKTKKMKKKNSDISFRFLIFYYGFSVWEPYGDGGFLGCTTSFIGYFGIGNVGGGLKEINSSNFYVYSMLKSTKNIKKKGITTNYFGESSRKWCEVCRSNFLANSRKSQSRCKINRGPIFRLFEYSHRKTRLKNYLFRARGKFEVIKSKE